MKVKHVQILPFAVSDETGIAMTKAEAPRRLSTRLPWGIRKRTGIGLPPLETLVVAYFVFPWGKESHTGKYVGNTFIAPYTHGTGFYDPRAIVNWHIVKPR